MTGGAVLTGARLPLQAAVTAATSTPADVLGLADAGRLAPGGWADLTLVTADLRLAGVLHRGEWVQAVGEVPARGER
jgi:N-acetylglucosamine-6-phosphate deacetylase